MLHEFTEFCHASLGMVRSERKYRWHPLRKTSGSKRFARLFGQSNDRRTKMPLATATARKDQSKPTPAPNSDFYQLVEVLNAEELTVVKEVRAFMESKVAPVINKYWAEDAFPFELLPGF